MKTKIFEISNKNDENISEVAELLKKGEVVALPTETVYGLCANALNKKAVKKIFKAKKRPADNPLIVHIANKKSVEDLAYDIPKSAKKCMDRFWPGPFTVILKKKPIVPSITSGGLESVAIRLPSNEIIRAVIEKSGLCLAAPSANLSGSPSPTKASHVINDMNKRIKGIVCSSDCEVGLESTVVSFLEEHPRLLRPGFVSAEELVEVIPDLIIDDGVLKSVEKALSPGMKYKHYAPKCEITVINAKSKNFCDFVNEKNIPAICFKEDEKALKVPFISLGDNPEQELFSALRQLDEIKVKKAYAKAPHKNGVGLALYNRLIRAAGFKEFKLPIIVGLTGPSGVGKSTIAEFASSLGFLNIDCDKVAKEVVPALKTELCKAFSDDILENGEISNKKLASVAFKSKKATEKLNSITLPKIIEKIENIILESESNFILLDGATLIESGFNKKCSKIIAVLADDELRLERFKSRDKLTKKEASLRLKAGKADSFYKENADFVIFNNGNKEELIKKAEEILISIKNPF